MREEGRERTCTRLHSANGYPNITVGTLRLHPCYLTQDIFAVILPLCATFSQFSSGFRQLFPLSLCSIIYHGVNMKCV